MEYPNTENNGKIDENSQNRPINPSSSFANAAEAAVFSQSFINSYFDYSEDAICVVNSDLEIIYANSSFVQLLASDYGDILGRDLNSINIPANTVANLRQSIDAVFEDGNTRYLHYTLDILEVPQRFRAQLIPELTPDEHVNFVLIKSRCLTDPIVSQDSLARSFYLYQRIYKDSSVGIAVVDPEGWKIADVNPAFCEMLGYSKSQLCSMTVEDVTYPEDHAIDNGVIERRMLGEKGIFEFEKRFLHKNGSVISAVITSTTVPDPDTGRELIAGMAVDITPLKQAQKAIYESEKKFKNIFHSSPLGMAIVRHRDQKIVEVNEKLCRLLGYTEQEMLNLTVIDITHPDDIEDEMQQIDNLFNGHDDNYFYEKRYICKDNSIRWVRLTAVLLPGGEEEKYGMGIVEDITEIKAAQLELKTRAAELDQAQSIAKLGNWTYDIPTGKITWSDQMYKIFGRSPQLGPPTRHEHSKFVHPEDRDRVNDIMDKAFKELKGYNVEFRAIKPDNTIAHLVTVADFQFDACNNPVMLFGTTQDISELITSRQKLLELNNALQAKNKELQNVIYIASHDLRSPLLNIKGFGDELAYACKELVELLKNPESISENKEKLGYIINSDIPESLNYIQNSTSRMSDLLNGLLKVSRAGTRKLNIQQIDMDSLIEQVISDMTYEIEEKNVKVIKEPLSPCSADQVQMAQVLTNLLSNAVKYVPHDGTGTVSIKSAKRDSTVTYCVRDNGPGIDPRDHEQIFDIFYRCNPKIEPRGEGIGLSIVKRIVDRHRGTVKIESNRGQGTAFFITIPA